MEGVSVRLLESGEKQAVRGRPVRWVKRISRKKKRQRRKTNQKRVRVQVVPTDEG